jgi:hypothetical protein
VQAGFATGIALKRSIYNEAIAVMRIKEVSWML